MQNPKANIFHFLLWNYAWQSIKIYFINDKTDSTEFSGAMIIFSK